MSDRPTTGRFYRKSTLFEISILKNIRGGADEPEAHIAPAGLASRKSLAVQQHHFVLGPVLHRVLDLIDTGFTNGFTRCISWPRSVGTDVPGAVLTSATFISCAESLCGGSTVETFRQCSRISDAIRVKHLGNRPFFSVVYTSDCSLSHLLPATLKSSSSWTVPAERTSSNRTPSPHWEQGGSGSPLNRVTMCSGRCS